MGLGTRRSRTLQQLRADLAGERELTAALSTALAVRPRRVTSGSCPSADVVAAARAQTVAAAASADLRASVTAVVDVDTVAAPVAAHLLAALRETLADVVRHAGARTLTVDLEIGTSGVTLCVTDDGAALGHDPVRDAPPRLHERAASLDGWCLSHAGDTGGGTVVVWHVPGPGPAQVAALPAQLADAVGPLTTRLSLAHGVERLAVIGDALRRLVDADCHLALVAAPDGHSLRVVRTDGFPTADDPLGAVVPRAGSLPWHALRTGQALRVGSVASLPAAARHLDRLSLGACLVVPLRSGADPAAEPGTVLGVARTVGRPPFDRSEVEVAVVLAAVGSAMLGLQPVQAVIDAWPSAEFDYTDAVSVAGFPNVCAVPRNVRR